LLADALKDRLLGFHMTQNLDMRKLGFLYYVAASSETLGDVLQRAARYSGIVNEGIELETECGRSLRIGITYAGVSRLSDRHQLEGWVTGIVRACRDMTGRELQPSHVRIIHQRIPESSEFDNFLGRQAEFGAAKDEVLFPGEAAGLSIIHADPYLNKLLTAYCDDALARYKAPLGTLQTHVENAIATLLPHAQVRLDTVAKKLGMAPRTLRRKLAAENITFARILEDLRIALAQRYLAEQNLSISRIAWLLGYAEVSAFSHAFRRLTGRTPRADRPRQRRPGHSDVVRQRVRR
jgi:AraC-like DNA-binding protein